MKRNLSLAAIAALGAFMLLALSGVPLPHAAHAQDSPAVAVELSSTSVTEGTASTVTMSFFNLAEDADRATTDYLFRADVLDADGCEDQAGGYGLGVDRKINLVDEDPEVRRGNISAGCPAGDYTVRASISDSNGGELASATATFSVAAPEPPASTDAALSSLALSGVTLDFGPATTTYTAEVGNDLAETTVTPTVNDDGATFVVRLEGTADDDSVIPLSVGENVITVVVTAEDGDTTRTYTVTLTRASPTPEPEPAPTVAIALSPSDTMIEGEGTEIAVTLSFGNLTFDDDRATTDYTFRADVKDSEDGDADSCENQAGGYGLGVDRNMNLVDEDPEVRRGSISAGCPAGVYTPPGQYLQRRQRGAGLGHRRVLRPPAAHRGRGGRSGHRFGPRSPAATSPCTVATTALPAYGPTGQLSGCPIRSPTNYSPTHWPTERVPPVRSSLRTATTAHPMESGPTAQPSGWLTTPTASSTPTHSQAALGIAEKTSIWQERRQTYCPVASGPMAQRCG